MPSFDRQNHNNRGIEWPGIIRIVIVQILVLLAVSVALVYYIDWSSDAARAEFMGAFKTSAPTNIPQLSTPVQTAKGRTICPRKS
jgi:hypothetical protein